MADPRDHLCLALDTTDADAARRMAETVGDAVLWHKVGLALAVQGGEALVRDLKAAGKRVFLDYKFHDIDQTVANAVTGAVAMGADLLTVHAVAPVVRAAAAAKRGAATKVVGVTVLTSLDAEDLEAEGWRDGVPGLVRARAQTAIAAGADGVVASAQEAGMLRELLAPGAFLVTPGIRPAGGDAQDQKRVATPTSAIRDGSDLLVIGRPILQAKNPRDVANAILEEINAAF
ncbi:MAG: orotidine-5'-phosphate decarboxylase [Alphaproteobacteria bacterium]